MSRADYENLSVLHKNCLPARSWFIPLGSFAERTERSEFGKGGSRYRTLSGEWEFRYFHSVELIEEDGEWDLVNVPSCWQTMGYEPPFYVNDDFTCPAAMPRVPVANPVGIYRRKFEYQPREEGERVILTFLGVCSAFHCYLNGKEVGYSQGSHQTSEFDLTPYLLVGENELTVRVYKWSDGSYLESQDMFRYNGIFREVYLTTAPKTSLFDFRFQSQKAEEGYRCSLQAIFRGEGNATCSVALYDGDSPLFEGEVKNGGCEFTLKGVTEWNAEEPKLYDLVLRTYLNGKEEECVIERVGFKTIDCSSGEFRVNGRAVKLKGVNLHESSLNGFAVTDEECKKDLLLIKSTNANAVRFAHYPPNPVALRLCDELGLYAIDEADLETYGALNLDDKDYFGKSAEWLPAFLDRMERLFERDKNHVCVIMWSMGNEAGRGENFDRCYEYLKGRDPATPVHYETCFRYEGERGYDLVSLQYSDFDTIEKWMNSEDSRPFFLCEYAHSMGAGPGSLKEYWEYVYRYPKFIGGCVWEWCDHAVWSDKSQTDPKKRNYIYGGDHGEYIHDANFCCDGMVYPDRTFSPAAYEVKNVYRPLRSKLLSAQSHECAVEIFNGNSFLNACEYRVILRKKLNGEVISEEELLLNIQPMQAQEIKIPFPQTEGERGVEIESYYHGESCGFDSFLLEENFPKMKRLTAAEPKHEGARKTILGEKWTFDRYLRTITGANGGVEIFAKTPQNRGYGAFCRNVEGMFPTIWRAPTDNDRPFLEAWKEKLYHDMWISFYDKQEEQTSEGMRFTQSGLLSPPKFGEMYAVETSYLVANEGIKVKASLTPLRDDLPPLPRFGMRMQLGKEFRFAKWYGLGGGENYPDFKESVRYGVFEASAEQLHEPYVRPQENGNRGEVRYLEVTNGKGAGLRIQAIGSPFSFTLRQYSTEDLERAEHRAELPQREFCELCIDGFTRGLGSAACGMTPLPQYTVPQEKGKTITFEFFLELI